MPQHDPSTHGRMVANMADFLELLSAVRQRVLKTGQRPTEIPEDLKLALIRLLSE
jgi:hypothetical protein